MSSLEESTAGSHPGSGTDSDARTIQGQEIKAENAAVCTENTAVWTENEVDPIGHLKNGFDPWWDRICHAA